MKALILIGGEGTRLRPLTTNTLKSLVPIVNRQFFRYQLDVLKRHGIKEVILSICHLPDRIKHIMGTGKEYGMNIRYVMEDTPLGTGGAVKNAEMYFDDTMIVMNGDILTDINLKKLLEIHTTNKAIASISLHEVADPTAYGLVNTDEKNRIKSFIEKPTWTDIKSKWINAGIYMFDKRILKYIPAGKNYSLERGVFPEILAKGETVMAYKSDSYWLDIGRIDKYTQANFDILEKKFKVEVAFKKKMKWDVKIGNKTVVHRKATLRGPIVIGDFCNIGEVTMNPLTIIGNHTEIGKNSNLERCIIWDNVKIGENVTIKNSIIGKGCEIQSDCVIDNAAIGDGTKMTQFTKSGTGAM
ncbi:MAG: NDP-sugar synthase [bacterium]